MPFIFTISNTARAGDELSVRLTDGDANVVSYNYTVQAGDTLQDISDAIKALINADIYFVAIDQTTYAQPGLSITQVTDNNYNQFSGLVTINYGPLSESPAQTMSFDDETNVFESFLSYHPEMVGTLGTILITASGGNLYTHDGDDLYNNFYGVQYESSITVIFNDKAPVKKTYNAVGYQSPKNWASPVDGDIETSMTNPQTGLQQISQLKGVDYELQEDIWVAAYLRDANSESDPQIALLEGDYLKGVYLKHKFVCPAASTTGVVDFVKPYVTYSLSGRNF